MRGHDGVAVPLFLGAGVTTTPKPNVDAGLTHRLGGGITRTHDDLDVMEAPEHSTVIAEKVRVCAVLRGLFGRAKAPHAVAGVVAGQQSYANEIVEVSEDARPVRVAPECLDDFGMGERGRRPVEEPQDGDAPRRGLEARAPKALREGRFVRDHRTRAWSKCIGIATAMQSHLQQ
jgi:hypothetical protein